MQRWFVHHFELNVPTREREREKKCSQRIFNFLLLFSVAFFRCEYLNTQHDFYSTTLRWASECDFFSFSLHFSRLSIYRIIIWAQRACIIIIITIAGSYPYVLTRIQCKFFIHISAHMIRLYWAIGILYILNIFQQSMDMLHVERARARAPRFETCK